MNLNWQLYSSCTFLLFVSFVVVVVFFVFFVCLFVCFFFGGGGGGWGVHAYTKGTLFHIKRSQHAEFRRPLTNVKTETRKSSHTFFFPMSLNYCWDSGLYLLYCKYGLYQQIMTQECACRPGRHSWSQGWFHIDAASPGFHFHTRPSMLVQNPFHPSLLHSGACIAIGWHTGRTIKGRNAKTPATQEVLLSFPRVINFFACFFCDASQLCLCSSRKVVKWWRHKNALK